MLPPPIPVLEGLVTGSVLVSVIDAAVVIPEVPEGSLRLGAGFWRLALSFRLLSLTTSESTKLMKSRAARCLRTEPREEDAPAVEVEVEATEPEADDGEDPRFLPMVKLEGLERKVEAEAEVEVIG